MSLVTPTEFFDIGVSTCKYLKILLKRTVVCITLIGNLSRPEDVEGLSEFDSMLQAVSSFLTKLRLSESVRALLEL